MKAATLYRVAAVLFVLFAAGHTFGFLTFKPETADGIAAFEAMNRAHFQFGGVSRSYGDFYLGFGLLVTLYLVFSAYIAWYLSGLARTAPQAVGGLGWVFFGIHLVNLPLSIIYFGAPPIVLSALIAISLGWAMLRASKEIAK